MNEIVYIGRDNAITLALEDNNSGVMAASDLSSITKIEAVVDEQYVYDSTANPTVVAYTPAGIVTLKLGGVISEIGEHEVGLILYDAVNTNGVVWSPSLHIIAMARTP